VANLWFPFYHHLSSSVMHSNYYFFTAVHVATGLNKRFQLYLTLEGRERNWDLAWKPLPFTNVNFASSEHPVSCHMFMQLARMSLESVDAILFFLRPK
jgi:hypothetical protein